MVDQALIFALLLLLIVGVSMQSVLFAVPIFQKMTFDAICHRGLMQMDLAGGLTDEIQLFLENHLHQAGFYSIVIHGDQSVDYGSEIELYVEAAQSAGQVTPALQMIQEDHVFVYHNSILSRHLITAAGTP